MDYINVYFFELNLGHVLSIFILKMLMILSPVFALPILINKDEERKRHEENRHLANNAINWLQKQDFYNLQLRLLFVCLIVSILAFAFVAQYTIYVDKLSYQDMIDYSNGNKKYSLIAKNICIPKNTNLKNNDGKFVDKTISCIQMYNFGNTLCSIGIHCEKDENSLGK